MEDIFDFIGKMTLVNFCIYNEREIIPDVTVEILRNSATGEISFGWYKGDLEDDE